MAEQPLRIGANNLLLFGASALLTLVLTANISADELPRELVVQCQGNTKLSVTRGNKPEVQTDTFHITLRLKDGSIGNIEYNFIEGKNCVLVDGIIRCELNTTTHNSELDTTSKEHRTVTITRATGETHLLLESRIFDGTNTNGEPSATIESIGTGVCHSAATKALF